MIEEETCAGIQPPDRVHIFLCQLEVEYVEVLRHPLLANGFGNDDDVPLRQPSEDDLRNRLTVLLRNRNKHFIAEDIVPSLSERSPRLDLNTVFLEELLSRHLLVKRMRLDLVDSRRHV